MGEAIIIRRGRRIDYDVIYKGGRLYYCDSDTDKIYELNLNTFEVINTADSPASSPNGIGGISNRLYHCNNNILARKVYELNPDTLAVIKAVNCDYPSGIGGISNRLFYCDDVIDRIHELDPETLTIIKSADAPGSNPTGVGGTKQAPILKINSILGATNPYIIEYLDSIYYKS